jgi:gamma-glutamyltranspeptidase / glutathione hydrolase
MHTTRPVITGRRGVTASGHYLATAAGMKMFEKGGNAIDAGVATGFALAVLKPHQNSLGGECPILVYSPLSREVSAISGQGTAPGKADIGWFEKNNIASIPGDGFLGATVPGMFGAYCTALARFGRLALKDVLGPAIELAENGFPVYSQLREAISTNAKRFLEEWPTTAEIFLLEGKVPEIGYVLKQQALADTLKMLAATERADANGDRAEAINRAIECFYKGEIAEKIIQFSTTTPVKDASGEYHTALLELEDFYRYETVLENPVYADYRNFRVFKCGTWTQGPVFLQQLKLLEGFKLGEKGHNSGEFIHLVIECSKLAFADREKYYGDPAFTDIPVEMLLSDEYNDKRRRLVNMKQANNTYFYGTDTTDRDEAYKGDTTHLDVIDDEGFMMSATPSGAWIPSSPVIAGLGFPLGTRAQMFNLKEGHPNCLQPFKRPRTTLTPTLALMDGKPWMVFGTPGGDMQDQWALQFFLNVVEFGMDLQQAVEAPSFHTVHFKNSFYPHTYGDGTVFAEEEIERASLFKLQELGHKINLLPSFSNGEVTVVCIDHKTGRISGAASAKQSGQAYAMGW